MEEKKKSKSNEARKPSTKYIRVNTKEIHVGTSPRKKP